jgi:hypothetical protein
MHELNCPSCGKASQHQFSDYLLMCPFCSATFKHNATTGKKDIYDDHFIVANLLDASAVRESALEWLRRLHHRPGAVDKEFIVNDVEGFSSASLGRINRSTYSLARPRPQIFGT